MGSEYAVGRYLDKIRAVEQAKNPYQQSFMTDGGIQYSPNSNLGGSSSGIDPNEEVYSVPSGELWWPTKGVPPLMVKHYKAKAKKPLDKITMHLDYYAQHNQIKLPSCDRSVYAATMAKYIEDHCSGFDKIQESTMFSPIDTNKFTRYIWPVDKLCMGYLRKDLNVYLGALWDKCHKELGLSKIQINSGYRDVHYNWNNVYGQSPSGTLWSMHVGACAVDIGVSGKNRWIVAKTAEDLGFGMIYIGKNFVHLDIGPWARLEDPQKGAPKYWSPTVPGKGAY